MEFTSLQQLVGTLERRPEWRSHQQFQDLLVCWPEVVGSVVAAQTRPLSIQRHVLMVSTSSPVWAQNLSFQRHHILKKLSAYIPGHSLKDIRFSPAKWREVRQSKGTDPRSLKAYHFEQSEARALWSYHPSKMPQTSSKSSPQSLPETTPPPSTQETEKPLFEDDPVHVFHHWAAQIQRRSQHLPKCPKCQCPTPAGELKRWSVCSLCATHDW